MKNNNKTKRIISLVLSFAMLLTLTQGINFSAYADNLTYRKTAEIKTPGEKFEFDFKPEKNGLYKIYSVGDYDTYGKLSYDHRDSDYSGTGGSIEDDDSGEEQNFLIQHYLYTYDDYTLYASLLNEEETGGFEIVIEYVSETADFSYEMLNDSTAEITEFYGSAEQITIPEKIDGHTVTKIGDNLFAGHQEITSINIPDTVTEIGYGAFRYCVNLANINIPSSITRIGVCAFTDCKSLTAIKLPNTITEIEESTFNGCLSLAEIIIPESVKSIGGWAFFNCKELKSIKIPASVTSIDFGILEQCNSLESIIVDENNKVYDSRESCNAIVKTASNELIEACANTTFPRSVTAIGNGAFGWRKIPEVITIPAHITKIDAQAFAGSTLKEITILNSKCDINNFVYPPNSGGTQAYTFETDVIIHGYKNSTAQNYAKTHGNTFIELADHPVQVKFKDLGNYEIYNDYVEYTSINNKFIAGTNPLYYTEFSPRTAITRAMFVAILYRMAGNPYDGANPYDSNPFSDIKENAYYYNAACWALDEGITNQTTFKPNNNVTREQTARFLFAYAESKGLLGDEAYKNVNLSKYPDYNSVHSWAVEPLQWANYNDMITGTQQGYINPQGATQRIHATRILYGFGKVCNIGNFE